MGQSPETIRMRLQELLKFQSEKQNLLLEKQNAQRELLKQEQQQLYEMFGLSASKLSISDLSSNNITNSPSAIRIPETKQSRNEASCRKNLSITAFQSAPAVVPVSPLDSSKNDNNQTKRPFLKRNQGLTSRFKIDPSALRLENLPKYKFAGSHRTSKFFREFIPNAVKKRPRPPVGSKVTSDLKLKPFPDMDDTPTRSTIEFEALEELDNDSEYCPLADDKEGAQEIDDNCCDLQSPLPWSNILNTDTTPTVLNENVPGKSITSLQNTPIREKIRHQQQQIDEPDIFHLLAQDKNMTSKPKPDSRDEQQPHDAIVKWDSHNVPVEILAEPDDCSGLFDEEYDDTLKDDHCHVRFADAVEMNEFDDASDTDTLLSINDSSINAEQTSTPINKTPSNTNREDSSSNPDLKAKTEQMKAKLAELDREIDVFRTNNTEITKMKQSHELERIKLSEERIEMEQQLNDERIRLEVILHDERMRLADEQKALEKRAKEMRAPNRKEREEVICLKEQIAKLERELSAKDQKHIAAQARLRAQIRTMEKDLKDYSYEIDQLKKENKKMDAENVRLRRQGNNKMLNEINRNIAKLSSCTSEGVVSVVPEKLTKQRTQSVPNLSKRKSLPPSSESASDEPDEPEPIRNQIRLNVPATNQDNEQQSCKREILNEDGSKDVLYPNGNIKKISADTMLIRMLYYNKDIKETNIGAGTVKYYYAATNTWHTSYLDGLEILEFPK